MLIDMSGGRCKRCGYAKCNRALSFHHREPDKKSFPLTLDRMWGKNWEVIVEEWEKCDLLCLNCHAEVEDEIASKRDTRYQQLRREHIGRGCGGSTQS